MARFLPLTVTAVEKTIRDAVVVTLAPDDASAFAFREGQYLTFRREIGGEEVRRSYSICSAPGEALQVGIKRVEGGLFSTWANEALRPGARLEALPPAGSFGLAGEPGRARHCLCFAGGSGITPVLSILRTVLGREPGSRVTLVYANRAVASIMFREEIEDLKNRYLGRFTVIHVLEQDAQEIELFTGRVDEAKCADLFRHWIDPATADVAFICGPEPMMLGIARALKAHGMPEERIRFELFASARPAGAAPRPAPAAAARADIAATITLDGAARGVAMTRGQTVLEAALAAEIDAPWACRAGVCSTCRARVIEGEVEMAANHALEDYEVRQGYVLTCQARPVSARLVVDYDQ